jgi:hypothetical protein
LASPSNSSIEAMSQLLFHSFSHIFPIKPFISRGCP